MGFVERILKDSRVPFREYRCNSPLTIWLTSGNQLMSSYGALSRFATVDRHYRSWRAHLVLEAEDVERFGITAKLPPCDEQFAVLLPLTAHVQRTTGSRPRPSPQHAALISDRLNSYAASFALMGNYCGGGAERVRAELMAVARALFRYAGLDGQPAGAGPDSILAAPRTFELRFRLAKVRGRDA